MAKLGTIRSAITSGVKILATKSNQSSSPISVISKLTTSTFSSSPTRTILSASRLAPVLASMGVVSLKPLHSAIASARLNSNLALDSSCWSSLSQALAVPR